MAKSLKYEMDGQFIKPRDFASLDIVPKDLSLSLYLMDDDDWDSLMISFFDRVATLGHFERLTFAAEYDYDEAEEGGPLELEDVTPIVAAVIRAIDSNPNLEHLDLSKMQWHLDFASHLPALFMAIEGHPKLRTFVIKQYPREDRTYVWLKRLLSRNRNIEVLDSSGRRCTDGWSIDELYTLNSFIDGSTKLVKETSSLRSQLVMAILTSRWLRKRQARDFQHYALLLSDQSDTLCEFKDALE
jgi:hypothetical protein